MWQERALCGRLCPNKPTPQDKKKARKAKHQALTSIKTWDDSSSENEAQHKM
jgi:hypothetical protein